MNINFTLVNEFLSFLIFFIFSFVFLFPKIISIINCEDLINFKNKIFLNYNKTLENSFLKKIIVIEIEIKKNFESNINNINNIIIYKKNILFNSILLEKNLFLKKIKLIFNIINRNFIKIFSFKIKTNFLKSFKKIFNDFIDYNKEFIIL
ncbi:hypothetical protein [Candidatus Carsonella ruddii]|uniref:Uncharacterized protein n=1 Tax=Carsonella ruddii TaxID=114186 RepID=A0A1U9RRW4_CARRU|nr:hypothetical protein [Candidatus Carsonella ruddii]AQU89423.1 hypothetical protein BW244_0005 [Candidatus Carsonella ruddii]